MKPFRHINARSLSHAMELLAEHGDKARLLAGGTDLLGLLKTKAAATYPELVINIKSIPGLDYIKEDDTGLRIGAMAKLADIADSPEVKRTLPVVGRGRPVGGHAADSLYGHHRRQSGPGDPLLVLSLSR